jgi:hypothetical protein
MDHTVPDAQQKACMDGWIVFPGLPQEEQGFPLPSRGGCAHVLLPVFGVQSQE